VPESGKKHACLTKKSGQKNLRKQSQAEKQVV